MIKNVAASFRARLANWNSGGEQGPRMITLTFGLTPLLRCDQGQGLKRESLLEARGGNTVVQRAKLLSDFLAKGAGA